MITLTLPKIKFVVFPVSIRVLLKYLIRTRLRYLVIFKLCRRSLRTNRCFDLIVSEISYIKSPSLDLLCLLRRFPTAYFKPAPQNSYSYWMNDCHSLWNNNSWVFIRNPDIALVIPRDWSRLSSIPDPSIITIIYHWWDNQTWSCQSQGYMLR
jgi:hypothetical protein